MIRIRRIISGAQTGVDRGALDAAVYLGLERGGYAPRGWSSEDGTIPERYRDGMIELAGGYEDRTRQNLLEAGATLILTRKSSLTTGSSLTRFLCKHHQRTWLVLLLSSKEQWPHVIPSWLAAHRIHTLNVAGPRESKEPGIQIESRDALIAALEPVISTAAQFGSIT